jgi:hypothetical protein
MDGSLSRRRRSASTRAGSARLPPSSYHWWLGRSLLGAHDLNWIGAFGAGGRRLFVVPRHDLVVAVTAFNYRSAVPLAILNRFVLPAVSDLA